MDGLNCVVHSHASNQSYGMHDHDACGFLILLNGDRSEQVGSTEFIQPVGTLTYFADTLAHAWSVGPAGMLAFTINFEPEKLEALGVSIDKQRMVRSPVPIGHDYAFRMARSSISGATEDLWTEALQCLEPLEQGEENRAPMWLLKARNYINDSPLDRIGLRSAAIEAGIDPVHLARVFRKHFGQSVMECVRGRKLSFALKRILVEGDSIGTAALDAGFSDQAHLANVCRKLSGVSPSKWRNLLNSSVRWSE